MKDDRMVRMGNFELVSLTFFLLVIVMGLLFHVYIISYNKRVDSLLEERVSGRIEVEELYSVMSATPTTQDTESETTIPLQPAFVIVMVLSTWCIDPITGAILAVEIGTSVFRSW